MKKMGELFLQRNIISKEGIVVGMDAGIVRMNQEHKKELLL